jgi:hypothetical protein
MSALEEAEVAISMDGKAVWCDCRNGTRSVNDFIERFRRRIQSQPNRNGDAAAGTGADKASGF